jgi:hypothetical protein
MNHKKLKHICKYVSGTQCGIWSIKVGRLYFYCSDLSGWHFVFLQRKPDKKLYGGFFSIDTAFGEEECTCDECDE